MPELFKNKKAVMVIAGILCGLSLILAGSLQRKNEGKDTTEEERLYPSEELTVSTEQLEKRLAEIIEHISGVSDASVLITFETSNENVYATSGSNQDFVIINDPNGGENAVKLMEINAKVRGIAVVCDFGGNESLRKEIIGMLTSLFDIGSNRISVMQSK